MKEGKTLVQLAEELQRQRATKKDFIAPSKNIKLTVSPLDGVQLNLGGRGNSYPTNDLAEEQIAGRLQIPKKYFDRMKAEAPELLAKNVNHWFGASDEKYMVRTLDDKVRGVLSSRFRPLDNYDLSEAVLPEMSKMQLNIMSCEITEKRMYIKAVTEKITAEITKGDVVQAGIVISNSEVGCGSVRVEPMIYRLVCLNGLISDDNSLRKYHVGRGNNDEDGLREYFKDETRQADDKAFWMKVRDIVNSALGNEIFIKGVEKMRRATKTIIDVTPAETIKVIENVQAHYALSEGEGQGILAHLLKGGDFTQYGLVNAVTRASADVQDYDRATDLERLGGEILELHGKPWENLVRVAA